MARIKAQFEKVLAAQQAARNARHDARYEESELVQMLAKTGEYALLRVDMSQLKSMVKEGWFQSDPLGLND